MTLFVGNLSFDASEREIFDMFKEFGTVCVCACAIMWDWSENVMQGLSPPTLRVFCVQVVNINIVRQNGRPKGFCFVDFKKQEDAERAMDEVRHIAALWCRFACVCIVAWLLHALLQVACCLTMLLVVGLFLLMQLDGAELRGRFLRVSEGTWLLCSSIMGDKRLLVGALCSYVRLLCASRLTPAMTLRIIVRWAGGKK